MAECNDTFVLGGKEFTSRFILGSGKYSLSLVKAAIEHAGAQIITLSVRRANTKEQENILDCIPEGVTLLPNTSGARDAKEAVFVDRDRGAVRIVRENLFWAFFYNAVGIPLAAGAFYPAFGWKLVPAVGALAMACSSLCVVLNALRLTRFSPDRPPDGE